jgi:eukaryotic-like serine/threonine-protein kinase
MTADRWRQIESLFVQAAECPVGERRTFLDQVCGTDDDLRRELESLLDCDTPDQRLVDIPVLPGISPDELDSSSAMGGGRIGPYRLIRQIGHGGMGAVYLGIRDDDQYQKQVAIKLLKRGMDTDVMLRRFRRERQILANLEHPFIARLIDGGATEVGLPYLVMEYVDGVPITTYCAEKGLSITERLRLFRLVCEAVQYAHQNLVVHRDIKPSNILTSREGMPKLLDFGIAKVLDAGTPAGVTYTQREYRMLTPDYASPEQVNGSPISTASDIYSLGAVLFELLTGEHPHRFTTDSLADMERAICQIELEKPSNVAGRNEALSPGVRQQLKRRLAGDLDNIVLTAMRKEPQRRYASAAEFSEDLRRHMEGLPVIAREDRWAYTAGKFIQRHRFGVMAATLIVASLIGGIVTTTIQARRAERRFHLARQLANAVVANVRGPLERLPGSTAARAAMIQTVIRYLDGLARETGSDPAFELEIADAYREVANVEAHPFRQNLGQTAAALGHYKKAIEIFERHTNRAETRSEAIAGLVGSNIEAGDVESRMGKPEAAKARLQKIVPIVMDASTRDAGAVLPDTWTYLYFRLGSAEFRRGAAHEALPYYQKALDVCKKRVATDHSVAARSTLRGAYVYVADAQREDGDLHGARDNYLIALRLVEEALHQPDATAFERSMMAGAHQSLANILGNPEHLNLGDRDAAILHCRTAVEVFESIAASDREDVRARDDLAGAHVSCGAILLEGQPAQALGMYQKAAAISEELSGADPSNTNYRRHRAFGHMGIGESLQKLGRNQESLQYLIPALEIMKSLAGSGTDEPSLLGEVGRIQRDIGHALLAAGDARRAHENYQQSLAATGELVRRVPSSLYFWRHHADSFEWLGRYYSSQGRKTEARQWLQKSLDVWRDWNRRGVAAPYAGRRERQAAALLAATERM